MVDKATAVTLMEACGRAGVPLLLRSGPGMGKSALVRSLAEALDVAVEIVSGANSDPTDFVGMPFISPEGDGVRTEPKAWAKRLVEAGAGILLLEELTTVPESTQAAMLAVALDKQVGEDLRLPADVWVFAAANPPELSAGGFELAAPMANRFCHVDYAPTVDEWVEGMLTGWAAVPVSRAVVPTEVHTAAIVAAVTAFVQSRPGLLRACPEGEADGLGGAWPSDRTWDMLARVLVRLRNDDTAAVQSAVFGLIGAKAGREFLAWLTARDLPDAAAVIADPAIVDWEGERPDRLWAVLNGVATLAATAGTQDAWRRAWGPLSACAGAGRADVAAAAARSLAKVRPNGAKVPATARVFVPILTAAGLMAGEDAA
ncbi:AAA family ATPase [Mycolicibacter senuensis]|uniref:AAA family ATPase n=2 Tax=Mycolicibacter longobardus TaxID=1108812 RepID=A0A1X1YAN3_9MYCO|nr:MULTISPECIES: MoxR family ATPase [Mycolicibacter]ORW08129.1 AAA family ATPase [Mycolicibacter longobardus]RAV04245.1 AAA family ATPase [Mycolicibacter senuensis]